MTGGDNARRIGITADATDQRRTENPAAAPIASGIIGLRAITGLIPNAADAEQDGMISSRHL